MISPIVCYVTDRQALSAAHSAADLLACIRATIAAGIDRVHIREKDLRTRDLIALTATAVRVSEEVASARTSPARVIVHDRLDVALATGAAGVHLGRESIPAAEAVRWCRRGNVPAEFLIGVSCHSLADARDAEAAGANYIFFGPVFDTPSKRKFGSPQGIVNLEAVCRALKIPVIAIGGIDERNAADSLRAGAAGIAAIRLFQQSPEATLLAERISTLHAWPAAPR